MNNNEFEYELEINFKHMIYSPTSFNMKLRINIDFDP